jgi:cobalt-zinc-cadmium efflux system protein
MGHNHNHSKDSSSKEILIAFGLNFTFAIIEVFGGIYTNSMAIISDAIHDAGDSIALLFAYYGEKISHKKADEKYTFGYRRFSILAALVNGLILLAGSLFIIIEAIDRLQSPEVVDPKGMFWLALLGIAVNSVAAYRLSKSEGINQKMVTLHLLEDLFGWFAVLVVSIVLQFKPWFILDSLLSIFISHVILRGFYKSMKKIVRMLLQKFPEQISIEEIEKDLLKFEKILDGHSVRGWEIDDSFSSVTLHILVPGDMIMKDVDILKDKINEYLENKKVKYTNIQFESNRLNC